MSVNKLYTNRINRINNAREIDLVQFDPSIRDAIAECDRVYKIIRRNIIKQPGYVVDWELVDKAWVTAVGLHCADVDDPKTWRMSGELYICHPRAVMEELAKLRCKSSVLAAALLHDTMEDCSMTYEELRANFSYEVAQIVSAVTAIKAEEKETDPHYATMTKREKHDFLDRLTDAKLIASPFQREAFLVRFADRAHNLQTIGAPVPAGKRIEKINSTRAFLIPAAHKLGMRYFESILSDWCMKFEGEDYTQNESARILENRNALTKLSSGAYSRFDQVLQDAMAEQTIFSYPKFNPYAKLRGSGRDGSEDEMLATVRRVMLGYELKQQLDRVTYLERSKLDLWEIILTCQDRDIHDMLENFLAIYRTYLKDEGIFFEYVGQDGDSLIVRLSDQVENNYRIVLIPESRLETYFIGDHDGQRLTMINEEAPGDALRPQITVYTCSPNNVYRKYDKCVPYGATVLDFAFIVDTELALTVKGAYIHKWKGEETRAFVSDDHSYHIGTVLSEGDVVRFDADFERKDHKIIFSKENVNFNSMLSVNTQYGKTCLIKHFSERYKEQE